MRIILNGIQEDTGSATILDLVNQKNIGGYSDVIEYNYEIIKKDRWRDIPLKENDHIEILSFVGGG